MLKVKPYRQTAGFCGPAALKMVLAYYGVHKTERELGRLAGTTKGRGTGAEGLVAAARQLGRKAGFKDNQSLTTIRIYLRKKIPVIVDWFSQDDGHYSVAVGMDKKFIYLQDPELGGVRKLTLTEFYRVWFDFPGDYLKTKADLILRRLIIIT